VFETATSYLDLSDLLQASMDGPNVNWKFYELVQSRLQKKINKSMLNIGSCGLHILHGAFKHGVEASGWNIDEFLKSVHWLLKYTQDCLTRGLHKISGERSCNAFTILQN
jgi:hypothetical protein